MSVDRLILCDFSFQQPSGETLLDTSPNQNHGQIHNATWETVNSHEYSLSFDGSGFVRVPHHECLNPFEPFTIEVWAKGTGSPLSWREMTTGDPPTRDLYFQVVGERIYFATNTDIPHPEKRRRIAHHLITGSIDTNGENWTIREHQVTPFFPIEPKMQVVGDQIYYNFFALDHSRPDVTGTRSIGEFYTARSNLDGSDFHATPRLTPEEFGRRTEQSGLQVLGERIYHAFVKMDQHGKWQMWTAQSNLDESGWQTVQRTTDGGWIPRFQATTDGIYYYYGRYYKTHPQDTFYIAKSDFDGRDWQVIAKFHDEFARPLGRFLVANGWIYVTYTALDYDRIARFYTGRLDVNGQRRQFIKRTDHLTDAGPGHIRIMGDRLYYCYAKHKTSDTPTQFWLAESNLDGGNWGIEPITNPNVRHLMNYGAFQMVGGRTYWSANRAPDLYYDQRVLFGTSGSNLVNKDGAFGIGLTEKQRARAFINCGQGYLQRGETMDGYYRHVIETEVDDDWHAYVMSFDGSTLTFCMDGDVVGKRLVDVSVEMNAAPMVIGEGFVGNIARLSIRKGVDVRKFSKPLLRWT